MIRVVDVLQYLPPIIAEYNEIQKIAEAENPEFQLALEKMAEVNLNLYLMTAGETGLARWEQMLVIVPFPDDNFETRRMKILTRANETLPYTKRTLEILLNVICGEGGYDVELQNEIYTLNIKVALASKRSVSHLRDTLPRIIPANIILIIEQMYNTWGSVTSRTWDSVKNLTWRELREEVLQ
jgi:hypothetical protein